MKRWLLPAILLAATATFGCSSTSAVKETQTAADAQNARIDEAPQSSSHHKNRGTFPFQGEHLTFDARHVATKAHVADATLQVGYESAMEDGTKFIPIIGQAASKSIVRLFARIDDRAEAYVDPTTWETIYSYKHLNENDRNREYNVWFWNDDDIASAERKQGERTSKRDYTLPPDTMYSIAWVYEIRTRKLDEGQEFVTYTFDGWTLNRVTVKVKGMEDVWTEKGFFHCRKFEIWRERCEAIAPRGALSGVFIEPARKIQVENYKLATAWLADDELHTPVRMVVDTGIGEFDLLLKAVGKIER